ncbi:hypothetical protein D6C89_07599 [Aureobasidium pullulans]|nr:hypothetical protein D6C89_07599 [Aureobasidium pullulans]
MADSTRQDMLTCNSRCRHFAEIVLTIESMTPGVDYSMLMFGLERCVPPSLIPRVRKHLKQAADVIH